MRIHVLSDLHLEFRRFTPPLTDADLVLLAGDIGVGAAGVEWALDTFRVPVVYLAGNHEFYGGREPMGSVQRRLRDACRDTHVRYLDNGVFTLGDLRVIGATLWTDFALSGNAEQGMANVRGYMNDFVGQIVMSDEPPARWFSPEDSLALHAASRAFIANELAKPWHGKTLVATHHAPSAQSIAPQFRNHPANGGFASHLDELVQQAHLWVHGHMHTSFDYDLFGCRVVCNPRGYPTRRGDENPDFTPGLVIEL